MVSDRSTFSVKGEKDVLLETPHSHVVLKTAVRFFFVLFLESRDSRSLDLA